MLLLKGIEPAVKLGFLGLSQSEIRLGKGDGIPKVFDELDTFRHREGFKRFKYLRFHGTFLFTIRGLNVEHYIWLGRKDKPGAVAPEKLT